MDGASREGENGECDLFSYLFMFDVQEARLSQPTATAAAAPNTIYSGRVPKTRRRFQGLSRRSRLSNLKDKWISRRRWRRGTHTSSLIYSFFFLIAFVCLCIEVSKKIRERRRKWSWSSENGWCKEGIIPQHPASSSSLFRVSSHCVNNLMPPM